MKKIEKLNNVIIDWANKNNLEFPMNIYNFELDLDENNMVEIVVLNPIWTEIFPVDKRYIECLEHIASFLENKNPIDEFLKTIAI